MKKAIGIAVVLLLGGCAKQNLQKDAISGPTPGIAYLNQSVAPGAWIRVVPSERALSYKEINVDLLIQQLRYDLTFWPHRKMFKNVRLVLLDYMISPPPPLTVGPVWPQDHRNERYVLTTTFYKCDNAPPFSPDYEVTVSIRADKAGPQEAMNMMLREVVASIDSIKTAEPNYIPPSQKKGVAPKKASDTPMHSKLIINLD